jgi:hypothetical protein
MFSNPAYRRLGLPVSRLLVRWDAALRPTDLAVVADRLAAAEADGVAPLVAFTRMTGMPVVTPSVADYERAFLAFRRLFPEIHDYTPWNEEDHQAQPTYRRPARAAAYYKVVRANCPGCTVLAADVLDTRYATRWLKAFLRAFPGRKPRLWGLHNYLDANHHRRLARSGTAKVLSLVPGQVWLTETGGFVRTTVFKYNERRAAWAIRYVFTIAHAFRKRIPRVYIHDWFGVLDKGDPYQPGTWDAGLTAPDGRLRPGYYALRGELKRLHLGCWSPGALLSSAPWLSGCG